MIQLGGAPSSPTSTLRPAAWWKEASAVVGGLLALTLFMTYPLARLLTRGLPGDLGDPLLNTWTLAWVTSRLPYGLQGVWDAPILYPYRHTLAFSEHLTGIAVLTAPVQWLSHNPVLAYNAAFLGSYVLAGAGMYILGRWLTGRRDAAWLAALAFAFHPYRTVHVAHLQVLVWGWMPIALWSLHRYFASGTTRPRWLAVFALAFLLQGLSNGYFLFFLALAVAIVLLFELRRCEHRVRAMGHLVAVAVVIAVLLAPAAFAYDAVRREYGLRRARDEIVMYSADVASYLQTTAKLHWWGAWLPRAPGERELFPGVTIPVLAGLVLLRRRDATRNDPRRLASLYAVMAVTGFLLSLGPEPRAWGRPLLASGPYDWLLRSLPGLDGLRVPARAAVMVYLALVALAAMGVGRLLARLPPRGAATATVLLALAIMGEGYGQVRVAPFPASPSGQARRAYAWLREAPAGGVIELPLGDWDRGWLLERELRYQYATLVHGKPIVNGFSGYDSPLRRYLYESPALSIREIPAVVEALRAVGVRYVLLHLSDYDDPQYAMALYEAFRALAGPEPGAAGRDPGRDASQVLEVVTFGRVVVFRLADWKAPWPAGAFACARRLERREFTVSVSDAPSRIDRMLDGDINTRWLSGRPQVGDEWIDIAFERPQPLALVRLEMADASGGDYPRELVVEGRPEGEAGSGGPHAPVTLYRGRTLPLMLLGLLREPARAPIEIPLPPISLSGLRLRQTGHAQPWFWSVNELVLCAR